MSTGWRIRHLVRRFCARSSTVLAAPVGDLDEYSQAEQAKIGERQAASDARRQTVSSNRPLLRSKSGALQNLNFSVGGVGSRVLTVLSAS